MLTREDRKEPLEHGCSHFTFKTCLDLSEPIQVIPFGTAEVFSTEDYSRDLASFIAWWNHFVMKDLNGFQGFSGVEFKLKGFKLV